MRQGRLLYPALASAAGVSGRAKTRLILLMIVLASAALFAAIQFRHFGIKQFVRHGVAAIEDEDLTTALGLVSRMYSDPYANNKQTLHEIAAAFFSSVDHMRLTIVSQKIEQHRSRATVHLSFKLVGDYQGMRGYLLGSMNDVERADLELEKIGNRWLLIRMIYPRLEHAPRATGPTENDAGDHHRTKIED